MTTIRDVIALALYSGSVLARRAASQRNRLVLECDEEEQQNAGCDLKAFVISLFSILVLALLTRFLPELAVLLSHRTGKGN